MPQYLAIGLAGGLVSALLLASASAGGMGARLVLFFLAPLPMYLAGLGWGSVSAAIAALIAALSGALTLGGKAGLVFLVGHGLPAVILCHLALLSRPARAAAAASTGTDAAEEREWYPPGRLVAVATLIAGLLALVSLLLLSGDVEALRKLMREFIDKMIEKQVPGLGTAKLTDAEKSALTDMMVYAMPASAAVLWLAGFLLNLWLAGRITQVSGRLARPWPDLPLMRFPRGFGLGLAGALAAVALLTGYPALVASGVAGAFLLAYMLMGLAIVHYGTRGHPARTLILWGVYAALLILNTWAGLVLALIAILEPVLPWRRARGASPDDT